MREEPRAANVIATEEVVALALDRHAFNTLLGPLHDVLDYNLGASVRHASLCVRAPHAALAAAGRHPRAAVGTAAAGADGRGAAGARVCVRASRRAVRDAVRAAGAGG